MASSSLTSEQWKIERQTLLQQIKSLEQKVQQAPSQSSSAITPQVEESILHEFYTLGLKIFEGKSKEDTKPTPTITKAFMNMSTNMQNRASSSDDNNLVEVDPKSIPGIQSESIDALVQKVFTLYKPPEGDLKYLQGNFAPVRVETPPTEITIIDGTIPGTLNGMMLRNGPDAQFDPEGHYSWMDGESMIHGIRFQDGKATYVARYTQTSRYIQQLDFNRSEFLKFGDLYGNYGVFTIFVDLLRTRVGTLDQSFGVSTANTGIVYHGRRIMALDDFGKPYVIYVTEKGDLKTLGIQDYKGELKHWLTPHPKIDPVSGEMFTFGSMREEPFCIYRKINKKGKMMDGVNIPVQKATYMHDLSITKNYVIFQELPYVYDPEVMKTGDHKWIYNFANNNWPRYGFLKRDAKTEHGMQWFEFTGESFYVFHNANAWEEGGTIVLYCCNMEAQTKDDSQIDSKYIFPAAFQRYDGKLSFDITWPQLYKMTFNMNTGKATKERISDINGDFPKINEKYRGRKSKYMYMSEVNNDNKLISIVKYNLDKKNGDPVKYQFETNTFGGEVVFVPKSGDEDDDDDDDEVRDEDDGHIIVFVHRENIREEKDNGTSYVYVLDAKTMKRVVRLQLPNRVPYGFHTIYVTEEEIQNQKKPRT